MEPITIAQLQTILAWQPELCAAVKPYQFERVFQRDKALRRVKRLMPIHPNPCYSMPDKSIMVTVGMIDVMFELRLHTDGTHRWICCNPIDVTAA